jgi:carbon monoxide dehydrogenase subunit G
VKFTVDLTLNKDRTHVWKAFDNPANMKRWMPSLQSFEQQSGKQGQVGAISKLTYAEDGRTITLYETITARQEPDKFSGKYTTSDVVNIMDYEFIELNPYQTQWKIHADFKFSGILAVIAPFMKKTIIKRTREDMERFKSMVESQ